MRYLPKTLLSLSFVYLDSTSKMIMRQVNKTATLCFQNSAISLIMIRECWLCCFEATRGFYHHTRTYMAYIAAIWHSLLTFTI